MLKIRLFGRCTLESDGAVIQNLNCARAWELIGYLACHRDRYLTRELVIETLWRDTQEEQGKRTLRQTLWQVQSVLGPFQTVTGNIMADKPVIETDGEWIRLDPGSGIWIDVARFEDLEKLTRLAPGESPTYVHANNLKEAVTLYRGQLMEDCAANWCIRHRELLHKQYLRMLLRLMDCQRESGDFDGAMATALTVLFEEPASDKAHLMIMRFYHHAGDRTSALRQFDHYKTILREEFNVPPAKALSDLNNRIREEMGLEITGESDSKDIKKSEFEERIIATLESIRGEITRNREDIQQLKESISSDKEKN
jgi:DNA-binding SARP family transcriptional activator